MNTSLPREELEKRIEDYLSRTSESEDVEFKSSICIANQKHRVEIIKEIVAIANSGGGCIIFGVDDRGMPTEDDIDSIKNWDPADITNQIYKYTHTNFGGFEKISKEKGGIEILLLLIHGVDVPMVFTNDGKYMDGRTEKFAFRKGTIYFRHGSKSEPCNRDDISGSFQRLLENRREKVIEVLRIPPGRSIEITSLNGDKARPVRIVDPTADSVAVIHDDEVYKYKLKEVVKKVNSAFPDREPIKMNDIIAVRKIYNVDSNPKYARPMKHYFNICCYSEKFVNWLIEEWGKDKNFFKNAREKCKSRK